jgi:hypothetical protein
VYKGKFNEFTMKKDEDVSTMFNRLNDIVNELKCLDFDVSNKDFSHKFLRCLPEKYETIVTLLVRSDLSKMTPMEVLGEVQTHDLFKQSQKEVQGQSMNEEKKNIPLKAKATQEENDDENQDIDSDEEMALIVKGLRRIMNKKKFGKMGQSSKKNPFDGKDCFNCGEIGHISINCPNKKEEKYGKKKDKKSVPKRKKYYKKEKNGQTYFVEWVFQNKENEDGIVVKNKSRLVAQGYTQVEGLDFDETFAPVARLEAIRILLAYACSRNIKLYQMDVKSAFLNGKISKLIMCTISLRHYMG